MTKKTRTILFSVCLILFLIVAPSVILYSQGYRFDFENKKVTQTGAFYFKASPPEAEIYLNGKLKRKTAVFFNSAFIENLLPRNYGVEIKKEGYYDWKKNLEIKEKQVTEVKDIVLFPKNPDFKILEKKVDDFYFSPDEKKLILKKKDEKGWYLTLYDLEKNIQSILTEEKNFLAGEVEFLNLNWSPDSKKILLEIGMKEQQKYFILEIDKPLPLSLISLTYLENKVPFLEKIYFNSQDSQKLFVLGRNKIKAGAWEFDFNKKELKILSLLPDIRVLKISDGSIYYLTDPGYLYKTDFSFGSGIKINETPFSLRAETEYELNIFGDTIFLKDYNLSEPVLYLFNPDSKSFEKFFEGIRNLEISPDLKKIAYFSEHEIWIFYPKGAQALKNEDKVFLVRFSKKINEPFWLNNHYLIFRINQEENSNQTRIVEVDNRDKINIVNLGELKTTKIFWNTNDKKLYSLSDGNLLILENLIK